MAHPRDLVAPQQRAAQQNDRATSHVQAAAEGVGIRVLDDCVGESGDAATDVDAATLPCRPLVPPSRAVAHERVGDLERCEALAAQQAREEAAASCKVEHSVGPAGDACVGDGDARERQPAAPEREAASLGRGPRDTRAEDARVDELHDGVVAVDEDAAAVD